MNHERETQELCSVCHEETTGGFEVHERTREDGIPMIVIDSTPDRNFNVCDSCNDVVCFRCSAHPDSGYCNRCFEKYREAKAD